MENRVYFMKEYINEKKNRLRTEKAMRDTLTQKLEIIEKEKKNLNENKFKTAGIILFLEQDIMKTMQELKKIKEEDKNKTAIIRKENLKEKIKEIGTKIDIKKDENKAQ